MKQPRNSTKKWYLLLMKITLLVSLFICSIPNETKAALETIGTHAQAAALIDVETGRILHHHQGDKKMLIASLTKVMTAIVAIENGKLSDRVKVSKQAYRKEGSSIYLQLGEEMSLEHMLYGLMLRSGNDAATAIAEHVGGSVEGFAYLMNEKAQFIGMENSHFVNPHGLNAEDHYSTANDMAKLTAYALRNPVFKEIVKTKVKKVPNPNKDWDYVWYNKNKMLSLYDDGDGVKTGYTKLAGRCLISSATKNGQQLAVVTLNDPNDWIDHANWLNYGFKHFQLHTLIEKGNVIGGESYLAGRSFVYALTNEELAEVKTSVQLTDPKSIYYQLGERGKLIFRISDKTIGSIPIFEENSPRFQLNSESAFLFKESKMPAAGATGYFSVLQSVIKALFTESL